MGTQAQTQSGHSLVAGSLSSVAGPFLIAGALLAGAAGGYALRGAGAEIRGAQAANAGEGTMQIVPRAMREGTDITPFQIVPREMREGTEITPFQAPAPRWTHEDDATTK